MPRRPPDNRRTQEERTATMRARLLEAAIECLVERGYAGTTTVEVARRAGVSRGAQVHHFPTREELVTAAMKYCHERRIAEFRSEFQALPADADPVASAIDLLWSMFERRDFYAYLELNVAARTDRVLRKALEPVAAQFNEEARAAARDLFPVQNTLGDFLSTTLSMSLFLMEGMALERIVANDKRLHGQVVAFWKTMLRRAVEEQIGGANGNPIKKLRNDQKERLAESVARTQGPRGRSGKNGSGLRDPRRARRPRV